MPKKLTIRSSASAAVTITRDAVQSEKLVYIAVANKPQRYPMGRSRVVYIGTTKNGAHRMAASAASKAKELLSLHGVTQLQFFPVTCKSRQNVQTWKKLERGLILSFKHLYGAPPMCNKQGKNMQWADECDYFMRQRLDGIVQKHST